MAKLSDEKQELVNEVLRLLEREDLSWRKTWQSLDEPNNPISNKGYKGSNNIRLLISSIKNNYNDPRWMTYKQAKENDLQVKKGEKSTPIYFYQLTDKNTKKAFDNETIKNMTEEEKNKYITKNVYVITKKYNVFNGEQIHGIERYNKENKIDYNKRNEIIEKILDNSEAPIKYDQVNNAFYSLSNDSIHLPEKDRFDKIEELYSVALHEMSHSTGHEKRLNRNMQGTFGDKNYAKEELIAEFSSIFIQQETKLEIGVKQFENNVAYIKGWNGVLKENPEVLFEAIKEAQKVNDYILEPYRQELKKLKEKEITTENKDIKKNDRNTNFSNIELKDLLEWKGEKVLKHGNRRYKVKEHDSLILQGSLFVWNSQGLNGNFYTLLNAMYGMDKMEAKNTVNDFLEDIEKGIFKPSETLDYSKDYNKKNIYNRKENFETIKKYLVNKRKIDEKIVKSLYKNNLLYLDEKNNINFVIKDKNGEIKGADLLGTGEIRFKANTTENHGFNVEDNPSLTKEILYVFESPVDLLSFVEMNGKQMEEKHQNIGIRFLSLSGVREDILQNYIDENVREMYICTDNDEGGNNFYNKIKEKYKDIVIKREVSESKDWNEDLVKMKEIFELYKKEEELTKDSDGDGLTDKEEREKYHTDVYSIDTDGDGISDFKEVKEYFTNPTEKNQRIDFRFREEENELEI